MFICPRRGRTQIGQPQQVKRSHEHAQTFSSRYVKPHGRYGYESADGSIPRHDDARINVPISRNVHGSKSNKHVEYAVDVCQRSCPKSRRQPLPGTQPKHAPADATTVTKFQHPYGNVAISNPYLESISSKIYAIANSSRWITSVCRSNSYR